MKKKIEVRARKFDGWEEAATEIINSKLDVSFFVADGEMFINLRGESYRSIILKKDGTWRLD